MALKKITGDFERALKRLKEAYELTLISHKTDNYEIFRDSTIQRFESTAELMWKSLKVFLQEKEGITCRSPKSCIREFFSAGFVDEKTAVKLLTAIDDRNKTSHTYHEEVAEEIFSHIGEYITLFEKVLSVLKTQK